MPNATLISVYFLWVAILKYTFLFNHYLFELI